MKSFLYLLPLVLFSCADFSSSLKIEGTLDTPDVKQVYLIVPDANNQPQVIDTSVVDNGSFRFTSKVEYPEISFLAVEGINVNFPFIAEQGTLNVTLYKDSLTTSVAKGTLSNDDFMIYKEETKAYVRSINSIRQDLQQASMRGDNLLVEDLQAQFKDVENQIRTYELDFINTHTDSFISLLMLERFVINKTVSPEEARAYYGA